MALLVSFLMCSAHCKPFQNKHTPFCSTWDLFTSTWRKMHLFPSCGFDCRLWRARSDLRANVRLWRHLQWFEPAMHVQLGSEVRLPPWKECFARRKVIVFCVLLEHICCFVNWIALRRQDAMRQKCGFQRLLRSQHSTCSCSVGCCALKNIFSHAGFFNHRNWVNPVH